MQLALLFQSRDCLVVLQREEHMECPSGHGEECKLHISLV